ncbi:putative FMN-linked oxidoreductase [Monocercomonoides exilis]|uniref:putative FMN-linked oxidoreductase n=1 Tax=Monocercomonoides exilis TaxID=2049356 RepID=UPI00355A7AEF|nr:putative FMN-linked oxidoreductase [Monocercomonoides exilis]|eukprot:MONOS_5640.1-p1 / transcript=MONOS_5640.1 / gene=MONOS_5640 / organism=Monocercomonoides_exilis_PA203 / gene_product=related to tRNA dihydrouridine synthase / transcript_product=related to tRNA dihydrouridine synthase / location=Mono_scaffold00166:78376-80220(+) / protein_length=314 / sequence_SO=supercontig / SO=protein_coding / is_pseudo=false
MQKYAKRAHYGAYVQDEWDLIRKIVSTLHSCLEVPVTAKFRKQFSTDRTVGLARLLEESGAQVICMHGRTRKQKGAKTGEADWEEIRIAREAVHVPFIANGSIRSLEDAEECLRITKADAVMSGEGLRRCPALFYSPSSLSDIDSPSSSSICWSVGKPFSEARNGHTRGIGYALEYLDLCGKYCTPLDVVKEHVHRMLLSDLTTPAATFKSFDTKRGRRHWAKGKEEEKTRSLLETHWDVREKMMDAHSVEEVHDLMGMLKGRVLTDTPPPPRPARHELQAEEEDGLDGSILFGEEEASCSNEGSEDELFSGDY